MNSAINRKMHSKIHRGINKIAIFVLLACCVVSQSLAQSVLIENVTIHTQTEQGVINGDALIVDGRLVGLGEGFDVPADAERFDGTGKIVTPGLFAAYTQLGLVEIDLEATTVDSVLSEQGVGPAFDVQYAFNGRCL